MNDDLKRVEKELKNLEQAVKLQRWERRFGEGRPRRERRRARREAKLPADRRCPRCQKIVLESRRWVVPPAVDRPCCRSCYVLAGP